MVGITKALGEFLFGDELKEDLADFMRLMAWMLTVSAVSAIYFASGSKVVLAAVVVVAVVWVVAVGNFVGRVIARFEKTPLRTAWRVALQTVVWVGLVGSAGVVVRTLGPAIQAALGKCA